MNDSLRFTIRDASGDDAPVLTQIAIAAKSGWGYTQQLIALWLPQLTISSESIENRIVYVAELDGEAVGFGGLDVGCCPPEIDDLWVLPKFQFRGIGRSLFRHLCNTALQLQIERVEIVSDPNAAPFYKRMGAKQIGWHPSKPAGRMLPRFEIIPTATKCCPPTTIESPFVRLAARVRPSALHVRHRGSWRSRSRLRSRQDFHE